MNSFSNGAFQKKTILIDLDSICADIMTPWLAEYNRRYDDTLKMEQVTNWDFHNVCKPECGTKLYDILHIPHFFEDLQPLPGAQASVAALRSAGHDVMILTAGGDIEDAATQKMRWCKRWLDMSPKQVMVTSRKELVRGDIIVDDSPKQIQNYRKAWPSAYIFGIRYPYNAHIGPEARTHLFYGWKDTVCAWRDIVTMIGHLSSLSVQ